MFKLIQLFSIILLSTVCILYRVGFNLTDYQYLYIDLVVLFPLCLFHCWTEANLLTEQIPRMSFLQKPLLISIFLQTLI